MRLFFATAVFLLSVTCTPSVLARPARSQNAAPAKESRVEALFQEGSVRFANKDYAGAARKFEQALAVEPNSPQLLSNLGITYHMLGNTQQAIRTLRQAVALDADMPPANLILGLDLVKAGKAEDAIAPLKRLLVHDPSNLDGQVGLASAYFSLHRYFDAASLYRDAVRTRPGDAGAWYGMGICFEHLAENTTRLMARRYPDSPYYLHLVGGFLQRQGDDLNAAQVFRQALSAPGGDGEPGLRPALGFALIGLGQTSQAERAFDEELRVYPGSLEARLGVAALAFSAGQSKIASRELCEVYHADAAFYESHVTQLATALAGVKELPSDPLQDKECSAATEKLRKALASPETASAGGISFDNPKESPGQGTASPAVIAAARKALSLGHYSRCAASLAGTFLPRAKDSLLLAQCASMSGRYLTALQAARQALQPKSENDAALFWEAEAGGRLAEAAFERAVTIDPGSWQGHVLLGDIYRQRKRWDLALSNYQAAAELKPSSAAPYLGIATVHWQNGEFSQAQSALQSALHLDPSNVQANWELGDILARSHKFREAVPYLRKATVGEPSLLAAHADLGKCYAASGEAALAIQELRLALPSDASGEIHYLLSQQYHKNGEDVLARETLDESQRLREESAQRQQATLQKALKASQHKRAAAH